MINLVIDIGNTFSKVALFNNREISELNIWEDFNAEVLQGFIAGKKIDHAIISSVEQEIDDLEHVVESYSKYTRFSSSISAKVINHYRTPQTLGLDRYAAVIGAQALLPSTNTLVIDAGTCITYDFIDKNKNYYGGSISPGLAMRFKAVHTFTGRLPLIEPDMTFSDTYGTDTRSSILSGIQNGILNEALGFIQSYAAKYADLKIILCGGDVNFFDTRLKNSIFAPAVKTEPNLVLIGLNEVIYQQND